MKTYIKKQVIIKAIQFTGNHVQIIEEEGKHWISGDEGKTLIAKGDYIIESDTGEYYPIKQKEFEKTWMIDKSQAYFWTPEWQKAESEADKDIKEGRVSPRFDNAEDSIKYLKENKNG